MRKLFLLAFTLLIVFRVTGQINMNDSTVRVYGYWNLNDKQTYQVIKSKYKINTSDSTAWDTTSTDISRYKVDITITDSTFDSYTIDWLYHDFEVNTTNEIAKKLVSIVEQMTITIRTDELGIFQEVVNWKDIRKTIKHTVNKLSKEMPEDPEKDKILKLTLGFFSSKESIEARSINDIHLFYAFHGGIYKLDSLVEEQIQVPNLVGGDPIDAEISYILDTIDTANWVSTFRMRLAADPEQLLNATIAFMKQMSANLGVPGPEITDIPRISQETWTYSDIHDSGWIIYTIQSKEVSTDGILQVEELSLELL